jgi:hypothetical protein
VQRDEAEAEEVGGAVERPDSSVGEVADIGREPEQVLADAELVDEGDDLAVALEEVMVEALERRAGDREGVGLPAKAFPAFPERYPVAALGQPVSPVMPPPMTAIRLAGVSLGEFVA